MLPDDGDEMQAEYDFSKGVRGKYVGQIWYTYTGKRFGRKGQQCRVLVRGAQDSCLVVFPDGVQAVVSQNALEKVSEGSHTA